MTLFPIDGLRSVELDVADLDVAERFYVDVWGLAVAARTDDALWLAADGTDHHVLALHRAAATEVRSVTFRAASADALDALARTIPDAGGTIVAPAAPSGEPGGGILLAARDTVGRVLRVVHGDERRAARPAGDRVGDGRPARLAHVNINSDDVDRDQRFWIEGLGFHLSDRSKMMSFVRTGTDHHAVVIADSGVNTLNHIAFLVPTLEDVMRGSGRVVDGGTPIGWGVGRHGPGDNVFAYFVDPLGIVVEYTAEILQVDESYRVRGPDEWVWPPGRTDQWGIAPPKTAQCKAAQLAIPFVAAPGRAA